MLLRCLKVNNASRSTAYNISVINLVIVILIITFFTGYGLIVMRDYDLTTIHIGRLALVEAGLHFLFAPFSMVLLISIKNDNLKWINIWVRMAITQAVYLFLLNFVIHVYITVSLDLLHGLLFLAYILIHEGFLLDIIVFMNNYHRNSLPLTENPPPGINKDIEGGGYPIIIHV